ncbi:hypothetical protein Nepgr_024083 [Nepenthes gracilis]|uniref:Uncharacterized protein n=1 Tax=Nepenthes gracilis TaxID=150966 RepID=A0AAD3T3Q3_NEPGR|nr:hypothetical protein Nepgr_024083 [Nepenthes gracilis]
MGWLPAVLVVEYTQLGDPSKAWKLLVGKRWIGIWPGSVTPASALVGVANVLGTTTSSLMDKNLGESLQDGGGDVDDQLYEDMTFDRCFYIYGEATTLSQNKDRKSKKTKKTDQENAGVSYPQHENGHVESISFLSSEKTVQELLEPAIQGMDGHLVEFSEALRTVAKALRLAAEGKACAQANAAE